MRKAVRGVSGIAFGLAAAAALEDNAFQGGDRLKDGWDTAIVLCLIVAPLVFVLTSDAAINAVRRGPRLVMDDTTELWRNANASRGRPDLQVLYARVRNDRDGGGTGATIEEAEVWMEARDDDEELVAETRGNWLDLGAEHPERPLRTVTLKPMKRRRYGIEIAGKFLWEGSAWLAGEREPSLAPGTYRIRASVNDGSSKGKTLQWTVKNPGADAPLELVSGANHVTVPAPRRAIPLAGASGMSGASQGVPTTLADDSVPHSERTEVLGKQNRDVSRVEHLLAEADELQDELWRINRAMKRTINWPLLPSDYQERLRRWNGEVLGLADRHLPNRDASYLEAVTVIGLTNVERAEAILADNKSALVRIRGQLR